MKRRRDEEQGGAMGALGLANQLAVSSVICVGAGLWIGLRLDRWLGTSPWLLILGAFLGAAAAFKVLYDLILKKWMGGSS